MRETEASTVSIPRRISPIATIEEVAKAGTAGVTAPILANLFSDPEKKQARNAAINQHLHRFQRYGFVKRGAAEPVPGNSGSSAFRWYITSSGMAYVASGGKDSDRETRAVLRAEAAQHRLTEERARRVTMEAAHSCQELFAELCVNRKIEFIRVLRAESLSYNEIGSAVGQTGARMWQLDTFSKVSPCTGSCRQCGTGTEPEPMTAVISRAKENLAGVVTRTGSWPVCAKVLYDGDLPEVVCDGWISFSGRDVPCHTPLAGSTLAEISASLEQHLEMTEHSESPFATVNRQVANAIRASHASA